MSETDSVGPLDSSPFANRTPLSDEIIQAANAILTGYRELIARLGRRDPDAGVETRRREGYARLFSHLFPNVPTPSAAQLDQIIEAVNSALGEGFRRGEEEALQERATKPLIKITRAGEVRLYYHTSQSTRDMPIITPHEGQAVVLYYGLDTGESLSGEGVGRELGIKGISAENAIRICRHKMRHYIMQKFSHGPKPTPPTYT